MKPNCLDWLVPFLLLFDSNKDDEMFPGDVSKMTFALVQPFRTNRSLGKCVHMLRWNYCNLSDESSDALWAANDIRTSSKSGPDGWLPGFSKDQRIVSSTIRLSHLRHAAGGGAGRRNVTVGGEVEMKKNRKNLHCDRRIWFPYICSVCTSSITALGSMHVFAGTSFTKERVVWGTLPISGSQNIVRLANIPCSKQNNSQPSSLG